jgi:hypothetical protein
VPANSIVARAMAESIGIVPHQARQPRTQARNSAIPDGLHRRVGRAGASVASVGCSVDRLHRI